MPIRVATKLYDLIPRDGVGNDVLLDRFLEYARAKGLTLYPAQEEAILELFEEKNVMLSTASLTSSFLKGKAQQNRGFLD